MVKFWMGVEGQQPHSELWTPLGWSSVWGRGHLSLRLVFLPESTQVALVVKNPPG